MRFRDFIEAEMRDLNHDPRVMIDFPSVRQSTNFSCGAAALQGVLAYYGIDFKEDDLVQKLDTNRKEGTDFENMARFARRCRLRTHVGSLGFKEVQKALDKRWPVILAIQAYADKSPEEYQRDYGSGHYVTVIGYDKSGLYFADPSMYHRGYLSYEECAKRWHDKDDERKVQNLGIIIAGTPRFDQDKARHIE